ncbi:MAG: Nif11-like leader peptide family RiPP precursor, partial [Oscillospiraceae bacterium]|nr:Nif11-like leader peptide family RiPP precursor [Oscillospiraceae bacterium]
MNQELVNKARKAKSVEELLALAKENGIELTDEQAKEYFAQLNPTKGELSDDELEDVAGGGCFG